MCIGRFIGCLVIAIMFGILGLFNGEGFLGLGFILMCLLSIPSLFVGVYKNE